MKKLSLAFCFLSIAFWSIAQEGNFTVSISTDSILLGNYIEVSFTLKNVAGRNFEAPTFKGFAIVGGPNQSSSFQMVNGTVSQEISYAYYIQATDVGTYFIEPASIETDEGFLETLPTEVIVYPNPDDIKQDIRKDSKQNDFFFGFPRTTQPPSPPKKSQKLKKKRKIYRM